jgi:hypothetical protein
MVMIYIHNTNQLLKTTQGVDAYLAVLHHVQLPQPCLIEWVAGGMDNMAQPVLLCEHQHRV